MSWLSFGAGAGAGAVAGSFLGPVGAAVGATFGGIIGAISGKDEEVAEASRPFGDGITVGSGHYLCKWNPFAPIAKCAQWADAQGLANAMSPMPIIATVMGETRTLTGGSPSPSGVVATGRTGEETVLARLQANADAVGKPFPWAPVIGFSALGLIGFGIWYVTRSRGRRKYRRNPTRRRRTHRTSPRAREPMALILVRQPWSIRKDYPENVRNMPDLAYSVPVSEAQAALASERARGQEAGILNDDNTIRYNRRRR